MTLNKELILDVVYPIGSIYMSVNSTSPASLFGGTWEQLKDRFLLGAGDTYTTSGATGGSTSHTHHLSPDKVVAQICVDGSNPAGLRANASVPNVTSWQSGFKIGGSSFTSETTNRTYGTGVEGNTDNANNMPPYLVVYMYKRTS